MKKIIITTIVYLLFFLTCFSQSWKEYSVHYGDTWYSIARANSITYAELRSANEGMLDMLYVGQVVYIPTNDDSKGENCFTDEEIDSLYATMREYEITDSLNEEIISNLETQVKLHKTQAERDSLIKLNLNTQITLLNKEVDAYKQYANATKPKWYETRKASFLQGVALIVLTSWVYSNIK
jgi:LysM repeat protein